MTLEKPSGMPSRLGTYELLKEQAGGGGGAAFVAPGAGGGGGGPALLSLVRVHKPLLKKPELGPAFLTEVRSATAFRHPKAVSVIEASEVDGELYAVAELHEGERGGALITAAGAG